MAKCVCCGDEFEPESTNGESTMQEESFIEVAESAMSENLDLTTLCQSAFGTARKIIESGHEAMPVFIVVSQKRGVGIIGCPWQNDEQKARTFEKLRELFKAEQVTSYAFVCEAWMSANPGCLTGECAPSESPDKVDSLMVNGCDSSGQSVFVNAEIITDSAGKRWVGNPKVHDGSQGTLAGRAGNLLMAAN